MATIPIDQLESGNVLGETAQTNLKKAALKEIKTMNEDLVKEAKDKQNNFGKIDGKVFDLRNNPLLPKRNRVESKASLSTATRSYTERYYNGKVEVGVIARSPQSIGENIKSRLPGVSDSVGETVNRTQIGLNQIPVSSLTVPTSASEAYVVNEDTYVIEPVPYGYDYQRNKKNLKLQMNQRINNKVNDRYNKQKARLAGTALANNPYLL